METFYDIDKRAVIFANYIIENRSTVRDTAKHFGISKSTVQTVLTIISEQFTRKVTETTLISCISMP